jgi:type IV pilus assembly protein PilW
MMQMSNIAQISAQGFDLQHATTGNPYNPANTDTTFSIPANYYSAGDIVTALGNFGLAGFGIFCNDGAVPSATNNCALGQYDTLATAAPTLANVNRVAAQIIDLQAQYGVAPAGSQTVDSWVDASGSWANPTAADWLRVKAIRIALVARSTKYETIEVSPSSLVLWDQGLASERKRDLTSAERHFRYKVFTLVVPVVNVIWADV